MGRTKNKQIKNVLWYFAGTMGLACLGILSTPLLTRILSQEVYARYGMLTSFCTTVSTFIYLGQDDAFMRFFEARNDSYTRYFWRCVRIPLALCVVMFLVIAEPTGKLVQGIFGEKLPSTAVVLISVYILLTVIQRFLMVTARMEGRAANYSISTVATKAVFLAAVAVVFGYSNSVSFEQIILCLVMGVVAAMLINIVVVLKADHSRPMAEEKVSTWAMFRYGLPLAITMTLSFSIPLVEKLIIRQQSNWETLAVYTAASIFITVMGMVKTTVNNIWLPYVYQNYQNPQTFRPLFRNLGGAITVFLTCIIAGTILTRRWLVLVLDASYFDAYLIAPAIVCGSCYDVLSSFFSVGIYTGAKTQYRIIIPVIRLSLSIIVLLICLPILGLKATGLSYVISIAISRTLEIVIGMRFYSTGGGSIKVYAIMGIASALSTFALFTTSFALDLAFSVILICMGALLMWREILNSIKIVRN